MHTDEQKQRIEILLQDFLKEKDEEKQTLLFEKINTLSPDPYWSDYIFYSDEFCDKEGNVFLKPLIEKIFSYKPILL